MNKTLTIKLPIIGSLLDRISSCKRKVKYGRLSSAQNAVDSMKAKGVEGLEPYKCRHCDGFHVGHKRHGNS